MSDGTYEDWVTVFESGTDYEADLVRDRLDDSGVDAVILTQRDHAFNLNVGDLANVRVLVPPDQAEDAQAVLNSKPFTDGELDAAAMAADPEAPDAHDQRREAMLDSGSDSIRMSPPEDEDDDDTSE